MPDAQPPVSGFEPNIELPTIIYYAGYSISLIALVLAVAVFTYFKYVCLSVDRNEHISTASHHPNNYHHPMYGAYSECFVLC